MDLLLKNGYVVDSASGFEGKADILIHDNRIREVVEDISAPEAQTVDCAGLTVIPGICDMHVHFRDPGQTHKENIITGGNAAAAGRGVYGKLFQGNGGSGLFPRRGRGHRAGGKGKKR